MTIFAKLELYAREGLHRLGVIIKLLEEIKTLLEQERGK